ncbi:MAG: triose-phosphate isomerase [Patescibacteria group bacterium]
MGNEFRIFINFKTYLQGTGANAIKLAQICEQVSQGKKTEIIPIVQVADVYPVKQAVGIPVWVQHIDPVLPGKTTGFVTLESVIEAGASGTLLNHSEHQIPPGTIKQVLARAKNLQTMVAAKTLGQLERLVKLKPDYIAYEIADLIGGKVSITDASPKSIEKALKIAGEVPLIVGAGVNKAEDLSKARKLGARGVLIASAVVLAEDPKGNLLELLKLL